MLFFFNDTATTEIYALSLHDALPIYEDREPAPGPGKDPREAGHRVFAGDGYVVVGGVDQCPLGYEGGDHRPEDRIPENRSRTGGEHDLTATYGEGSDDRPRPEERQGRTNRHAAPEVLRRCGNLDGLFSLDFCLHDPPSQYPTVPYACEA